jgi:O-antigen/teichoic acid export membrane protein
MLALYQAMVALAAPIVGLNVSAAVGRRFVDSETVDLKQYLSGCLVIIVFFTGLTVIVFKICSGLLSRLSGLSEEWLWTVPLAAGFQCVLDAALVVLQMQHKQTLFGALRISKTFLETGLTVALVVWLSYGWDGPIYAQLVSGGLVVAVVSFIFWRHGWLTRSINFSYISDAVQFGAPLIPHVIGSSVIVFVDRIFIARLVGLADAGLYTAGYQVGMIISLIQTSFNQAWVPWLFESLKRGGLHTKLTIVRISYLYFVALTLLAVTLGVAAPYVLKTFLGHQYESSGKFVIWIAMGYAFNGMYKMVANYIFYSEKTYLLAIVTFCVATVYIPICYLLIVWNGALGSAQASTIIFFMSFVGTWLLSARVYPMPWRMENISRSISSSLD